MVVGRFLRAPARRFSSALLLLLLLLLLLRQRQRQLRWLLHLAPVACGPRTRHSAPLVPILWAPRLATITWLL